MTSLFSCHGPKISDFLVKRILPIQHKHIRKIHDLRFLFFELTHDCNLSCLHCGSDCIRGSGTPPLPPEKIIEVLTGIKQKYNSEEITIILSGGEPLCYENVFDLGKKISDLRFPWGMVTNGFGWTKEAIEKAKAANMLSCSVSLDGLEKNHDWLRGRKFSFQKAVKTISMLKEANFLVASDVITCVNKRNLGELENIYNLLTGIGVQAWRLFLISPIGRAKDVPELFLNKNEFHTLMNKIIEFKNRGTISVNYTESGYLSSKYEHKVRDHYYFCQAGIKVAGIMVNGDILACPNIDRRFKQGNIYTDSFVDIWENKYEIFRNRSWMKTGECKTCKEWDLCQGNAFHLWDIDKEKPRLCHCQEYELT